MRIFISYASENKALAEPIYYALVNDGHKVFFDRANLSPGEDYHSDIRKEIDRSDLFVFLISEHSLSKEYTRTELKFAEKRWIAPKEAVLPVMIGETDYGQIPNYLKSVTILESSGSIAAEVADEVRRIAEKNKKFKYLISNHRNRILTIAVIIIGVMVFYQFYVGIIRKPAQNQVLVLTPEMLKAALAELEKTEVSQSPDEPEMSQVEEKKRNIENLKKAIAESKNISEPLVSASGESYPKWLQIAMLEQGQQEIAGERHNPRIIEYIESVNKALAAEGDELPWVSFFVDWVFQQVGIQGTNSGRARSWLNWGSKLETPRLGCVTVFSISPHNPRSGGVGFFISETASKVLLLLGNNSNAVRIGAIPKRKILGYRWPPAGPPEPQ